MGWSERHALFERLLALRDGYPMSNDRTGVLSIADAIRYAEAIMAAASVDPESRTAQPVDSVAIEALDLPAHPPRSRRLASDPLPPPIRYVRSGDGGWTPDGG